VEGKSYFLGELFEKVMFPDKQVATRSKARVRRQAVLRHGIALGLVTIAIGMALLPVMGFRNNREALQSASAAVGSVEEHYAADTVDPIKLEKIEPLRAIERELAGELGDEGIPFAKRFGMYQGKVVYPRLRDLYIKTVREQLMHPLLDIEIAEIKRFVAKYDPAPNEAAPQDEHDEQKARLRTILLLTGEYGKGEPGLDEEQKTWLAERVADLWAKPLKIHGEVASRNQMVTVAATYIEILATEPTFLFERDAKLVEKARKILRRTDQLDALLAELIKDVEALDLDLPALSESRVALKNDNRVVRGAYTRQAWEETVRDKLAQPLDNLLKDEWVLGRSDEEAKKTAEQQMEELRSKYFENYIAEWKQFIGAIYIERPTDYAEAQSVLEDLTRGTPPPLGRLSQYVAYHTDLQDPPAPEEEAEEGLIDAAADAGTKKLASKGKAGQLAAGAAKKLREDKKSKTRDPRIKINEDVRVAFEGLARFGAPPPPPPVPEGQPAPPPPAVPLDRYQEELRKVRDALKAKIDHETAEDTQALVKTVEAALTSVEGLINEYDAKGWTPTLQKLLPPPIIALRSLAGQSANRDIANKWCNDVVLPMREIAGKYPFKKEGAGDVSMSIFGDFFKPETGKLWAYYSGALAGRVPKKHGSFALAKTGAASATSINPAVVAFLNRADDLRSSLFPIGSDKMLVEFEVYFEPTPNVKETTLVVDGQSLRYRNDLQDWQPLQWPGEDKPGAELVAAGFQAVGRVTRPGKWGLFRLLEEGTIDHSAGTNTFVVKWDLRDQDSGVVKIRFRFKEEDSPFFGTAAREVGFLEVFRHADIVPPEQLVIGGPPCAD
jgi:type VI secretion system protein ImpL